MLKLTNRAAPGALLAAAALFLAACGGPPPAPTAAPKPAETKPTTAPATAPAGAASPAVPASASPAAASPAASPSAAAPAASPASAASPPASPAASASPAAAASPVASGEIDTIDARMLSIATNTGVRKVRVADNAAILIEGKGVAEDLKAGAMVGVTGKPDGTAVVVRLFPPGIVPKPSQFPMGGPQTGNVMTNASIVSFDGKTLVVDLGGEKTTLQVPPEAQVIKPVPSNFGELKPGVRVIAVGAQEGDVLVAQTVTIVTQPPVVRAP